MHNQSRTVDALRAQHRRRASSARIAWHMLVRKGQAKLPPEKPNPDTYSSNQYSLSENFHVHAET